MRHPSSAEFHRLLTEIGELHDKKQADYGTRTDPFANVRATEEWGIPAWAGAMIRANDKLQRMKSMLRNGKLENEALEDSFLDIAVYALIGLVLYREQVGPSPFSDEKVIEAFLDIADEREQAENDAQDDENDDRYWVELADFLMNEMFSKKGRQLQVGDTVKLSESAPPEADMFRDCTMTIIETDFDSPWPFKTQVHNSDRTLYFDPHELELA